MEQEGKLITQRAYPTAWPLSMVAHSRLVIIKRLVQRNGLTYPEANMKARLIRILFYMREMGDQWVSVTDLVKVGAGKNRDYRYMMPDGVKCGIWEEMLVSEKRHKYRITEFGKQYLADSEALILEEMENSLKKIRGWKAMKSRSKLAVGDFL